jgi:hypothetical protein
VKADSDAVTPDESLIRRFSVGVHTLEGTRGGQLEIFPGVIVCRLGRAWGAKHKLPDVLIHTGTSVDVYHARFVPFWCNVGLVVVSPPFTVVAVTSAFSQRTLVEALHQAAFTVRVQKTLADVGNGTLR